MRQSAMNAIARPIPDDVLDRIRALLGPKGWTSDRDELAPHLIDERRKYRGDTPLMARPASTEEVAAVVSLCAEESVPIVPQGGNTSMCGASVPFAHGGEIILNLSRMNQVRVIDPLNHTITVEAGCVLADVQAAAAAEDRLFPLSLGGEGTCQIGGNLSTNAGGTGVLNYGNTRDLVLGLEVVLPDGRVWDGLRALRKDNTGYDLKHLFVGAEGTLGIITAAVLKLFPRPREVVTALVALGRVEAAVELLSRMRAATGDSVTGFELMPRNAIELARHHIPDLKVPLESDYEHCILIELSSANPSGGLDAVLEDVLGQAFEDGLVTDAVVASSTGQAAGLWRIREAIPESQKMEGGGIKHDVSVAVSRVPEFIREATARVEAVLPDIRVFAFGHVGDGNVHFNLNWPVGADRESFLARWGEFNRIVHDLVAEMGGSISAEHGIGRLKREELAHYAPAVELDLMRRIKAAFDPAGIMNPGKVL
jgi:FAD/FMN-containing dehydrogenase